MQLKPRDTKGALTRRACRNGAGTSFRHLFYIHSPQRMQAPALDLSPLFCFVNSTTSLAVSAPLFLKLRASCPASVLGFLFSAIEYSSIVALPHILPGR